MSTNIERLGRRTAVHLTDTARQRKVALGAIAAAVIGLGGGVPLTIAYFTVPWSAQDARNSPTAGYVPAGLTILGLLALGFAITLTIKAARSQGESFDVYEQGIVHRRKDSDTVIGWPDITGIRTFGVEQRGLKHLLGTDFRCVLTLADDTRIRFSTHTADAPGLAATINAAVNRGTPPTRPGDAGTTVEPQGQG